MESHAATHLHRAVIDVKRGITWRVRASTPSPFHSTARRCVSYSVFIETPPKQSGMAGTDGFSNPGKLSFEPFRANRRAILTEPRFWAGSKMGRAKWGDYTCECARMKARMSSGNSQVTNTVFGSEQLLMWRCWREISKKNWRILLFAPGKCSGWQLQKGCLWFRAPAQMQNLTFFAECACGSCCTQYATKTFFSTLVWCWIKWKSGAFSSCTKQKQQQWKHQGKHPVDSAGKMEFILLSLCLYPDSAFNW